MFIGRKQELESLEKIYSKNGLGMTVIYGRRRVGKSTLITEFIKDKRAIYYIATKIGAENNTALFAEQAFSVLDETIADVTFTSIENVLDLITKKLPQEKIIIAIDELPYWAEADEGLLSIIQKYMDSRWNSKNLMIILCGSSLSFMTSKVLSEKSPLFGRRDSQIKLEPFDYLESALFTPEYTYEEKAICYGITGGIAKYLSLLNPDESLHDNIVRLFLQSDGYLYDEPHNLLTQEFTDVTLVNNIIEAVANGANSVNLISDKVKASSQTVIYFLDKLITVGLVEKKNCITEEKNKKKTQYILKDTMLKFWYEFIPKAQSIIAIGQGRKYYEKNILPLLHLYMGNIFEQMCRYYTLKEGINEKFGSFITAVGNWWGMESYVDNSNEKIYQTADIDVVAISDIDHSAVIGECKFRNEKIDKGIYDVLVRRSSLISSKYRVSKFIFFSLSGYTEWFKNLDSKDVLLLTLNDLYQ